MWKPLAEHYERGELGIKTGSGFYNLPYNSAAKLKKHFKKDLIRLVKQDLAAKAV